MDRRGFLKIAAGVGSALACPAARAQQTTEEKEFVGVLVGQHRELFRLGKIGLDRNGSACGHARC